MIKKSHCCKLFLSILLLHLLIATAACAQQTFIKQPLNQKFNVEHNKNHFEVLSLFIINNHSKQPWLYELSGIAWDNDQQHLICVTDTGYILVLRPEFKGNKLSSLRIITHHPLLNGDGEPLHKDLRDSEGIALLNHNNQIQNDTELVISFERTPRIIRYNLQGKYLDEIMLPGDLTNKSIYQSDNKQIEAITELADGDIVFGPERPINKNTNGFIALYNSKNKIDDLVLKNPEHGSLVGLTTINDTKLLALERVFINVFTGLQFHLHHIDLDEDKITQHTLFSSRIEDGLLYDNFEGVTHHRDNYFFMVSDDNQNAYQRSIIIYFRLPGL